MKWRDLIIRQSFYNRKPQIVARDLLGKFLVRKINNQFLVGRIVETEAYLSKDDPASHNFKGKNKRNVSLYKDGGHAYVHSMRQYCLLDVVTESPAKPGSVLIRALEPIEGIEKMKRFRDEYNLHNLTNGPGKVCRALNITKNLDGIDLTNPDEVLFIVKDKNESKIKIITSLRIGISKAKNLPLRFHLFDNKHVSKVR